MNGQTEAPAKVTKGSAMHGESGYARVEKEAYFTPAWVTEALIKRVNFRPRLWEPACGRGDMHKVLTKQDPTAFASDIASYGYGRTGVDFFKADTPPDVQSIVTNPPYSNADNFVARALALMRPAAGMVAMLMRNEWDSAKSRARFFARCPAFRMKLVLTRRPRWSEEDIASPRHNFAWFIWDWRWQGPPTIAWSK